MGKKTFARKARLVEGARWYVDFTVTHLPTGTETRSRKDFGLNSITDLHIRREVGTRIAAALEDFIIEIDPHKSEASQSPLVARALPEALAAKIKSGRKASGKNYKASTDWLLKWLASYRPLMTVQQLSLAEAKVFKKWLMDQKEFTGKALNNYRSCLVTLWNELKEMGMATENPWSGLKRERVSEKKRRIFTSVERRLVAEWAEKEHYYGFRVILLIYYCHIRPAELVRLKFSDFDVDQGLIHISPSQSKTWKRRTVTIPSVALRFFDNPTFRKNKGWYWLGANWEPQAAKALNVNRLFKWHNDFLKALLKRGILDNIEGLTLYSWKDTGISVNAKHTSLLAAQDQAGHTTMNQTLVYYHKPLVNEEYKAVPDTLFD